MERATCWFSGQTMGTLHNGSVMVLAAGIINLPFLSVAVDFLGRRSSPAISTATARRTCSCSGLAMATLRSGSATALAAGAINPLLASVAVDSQGRRL